MSQVDSDVIVEYVAAPAPDIEELIQQAVPGSTSSAPAGAGADADADGDGPAAAAGAGGEDEDAEEGYGGLGLGATAGLGSSGGGGGLGLGFTKASEPSTSASVDPEVRRAPRHFELLSLNCNHRGGLQSLCICKGC